MNKKKIIIIASSVLALLLIIWLVVFLIKKNGNTINSNLNSSKAFTPDFLTAQEKDNLKIPADMRIQAMARDQAGDVTVYKIIKNDSDIVDPSQVAPISPRTLSR